MTQDRLNNKYFEWLFELVCKDRFAKEISFRKLLMRLHRTPFTYIIERDRNRAEDGISLRRRFIPDGDELITGPCSILEMMIALAIRCEDFMDDPSIGDRMPQWFWGMVTSLGLGPMTDSNFDRDYVDDVLDVFLDRGYAPNGKGGLFTIKNCKEDLRYVEIWYQLCWYLDSIN